MAKESSTQGEEGGDWLSEMLDNLQRASDEALEIFWSGFNTSQTGHAPPLTRAWGGDNKEGEGKKQFYFGDPSDYNMDEINGPRSQWSLFTNNVKGFMQAIEWTEPWLIGVACLHLLLLIAALTTRNNTNVQMTLFVVIMGSVYLAERLNVLAAANWKSFATQNYFDTHGVFMSTLWSTPLLLIGVVMLFQSLYTSSSLLIQVKRRQLRQEFSSIKKAEGTVQDNVPKQDIKNESKKSK
eukprot:CAMPEP_0173081578 /NCGR_PEP_ID=MMETSP1102-20130122/17368_1 /TAXON_ID=49646 /ORGANISM="Geminigera sp., Strain Caron Lab Isolate" /LENGTH=238 /DNA_ID=CAMNT_0013956209 /DNA_START=18 /DNA_END=735 /DNA_ORIENTATION=-